LDTVSVFGSVKKTVLSKNFRGGEIVNVFGGAELDFTQADINGKVIIDITQIFGGVKMIVPPHWQVVPDIAAVFAGIEDKRMKSTASVGSEKVLVLKGVSIFAGVDIRSY
jgi:predicted membrane protein